MKRSIAVVLFSTLCGCASPAPPDASATDVASLRRELATLKDSMARLENKIGHLQSNVEAASADDEFSEMVIDYVRWARPGDTGTADVTGMLLCHPRDWRGFGKLKRFTELADHQFSLEADGHQPIDAQMWTGGISNDDGSTRFTMLTVTDDLAPGVMYRLRPRNQNDQYRWIVGEGVMVAAR